MKHSKLLLLLAGFTAVSGLAGCGETSSTTSPTEPGTSQVAPETSSTPSTSEDSSVEDKNTFGEGITEDQKVILAKIAEGAFTKAEFTATDKLLNKFLVKEGETLKVIIYEVKATTSFLTEGFSVFVGVDAKTYKITGIQTVGKSTTHTNGSEFKDNDLGMTGTDGSTFDSVAGSTVTSNAINEAAKVAVKAVKDEFEKPVAPERETFTVSFDLNGGTGAFAAIKVEANKVFPRPATDPVKADYNFIGWYLKGTDTKYDFTKPVTEDITLVARYQSAYTFHKGEILKAPKVGKDGKIVIPAEIDGETVTTLTDHLFAGNTELKEIVLPATVTNVKFNCFEGCTSLVKFSVGSTIDAETNEVKKDLLLAPHAFEGCTALQEFTVPSRTVKDAGLGDQLFLNCTGLKKVTFTTDVDINNEVFKGCTSLKEVVFTKEDTTSLKIKNNAFEGCTSLTDLTNFTSVTELGNETFLNCIGLTKINLGKNFKNFSINSFKGCTNLSEFVIDEANTKYESFNHGVYTKGLTKLEYQCPTADKFYEFPAKTTSYTASAFDACTELTEFRVAEGNTTYSARDGLLFKVSGSNKNLENIPAAFKGAVKLTGAERYKSYMNIGKFTGVTTFETSPEDTSFETKDGVVYTKSTSSWNTDQELIFVSRELTGTLVLPATVKDLGAYALNGTKLDGIVISYTSTSSWSRVIDVDTNAFVGVKDTFKVYVPDTYYNSYVNDYDWKKNIGLKYLQEEAYVAPTTPDAPATK